MILGHPILRSYAPGSIIVMQDDFTGTVIDTDKWTVSNPGSPNYTITQNNALKLDQVTGVGVDPTTNYIWSENYEITKGSLQVDAVNNFGLRPETIFGLWASTDGADYTNDFNLISIYKVNSSLTAIQVRFNNIDTYTANISLSYNQVYKITYDDGSLGGSNGDIKFYYWDSGWVQIGITVNQVYPFTLRPYFKPRRLQATACSWQYDNFYLTNGFYETNAPV